ncbi:unnamed protein product, partial [Prorocentrum cordatum]
VPEELPEFEWGLEGQAWGQQLFVDGSGRHSSFVEVRRSERYGGMRPIQLGRPPVHVLSDHMSFVQEVHEWQGRHTRPRAQHAIVWRQIAATVEGSGVPMPTAERVRANRELEDAVLADGTAFRYVGNFWADVFAKMGSASIMVSEVHVRACEIQLRDVREAMRHVAWAAERAVRLSVGGSAAVPQQVAKVAQVGMKAPELSIVAHDIKQLTNGVLKCAVCYRFATTKASLQTVCCSPCEPPTVGVRHVTETAGFAIWCAVCGAWSSEPNRLSPKFRDPCRGPSKVPRTRRKEKDAVKQLRRGLHPNTRVALETG